MNTKCHHTQQSGQQRLNLNIVIEKNSNGNHQNLSNHNHNLPIIKLRLITLNQKVISIDNVWIDIHKIFGQFISVLIQSIQHIQRHAKYVKNEHRNRNNQDKSQ